MTQVEKGYGIQEKTVYKYAQGKEEGKLELFIPEGRYGTVDTEMGESVNLFIGSSFNRKTEANMAY